ncbi:uncharacterized protein LOC142335533 [Convolutriloba macropyga]|uniref:uncharacterized protein LOC142335533 n=1 Tax=Convolutriloba macropyga TaxID=536237 RepID=UPI003F51FA2D
MTFDPKISSPENLFYDSTIVACAGEVCSIQSFTPVMSISTDLEFVTWDKLISENRWYTEQSDVVKEHNRMKETKNVNAREQNDPRGNSHVITGRWDGSTTNSINTYSHNCREKVSELT